MAAYNHVPIGVRQEISGLSAAMRSLERLGDHSWATPEILDQAADQLAGLGPKVIQLTKRLRKLAQRENNVG